MVSIVLGMHKSGTTLVSSILHKSGISMGLDLVEANLDYQDRKGESSLVREINDKILGSEGVVSLYIKDNELRIDKNVTSKIEKFIEMHTSEFSCWGFKDPRTVLTLDVWAEFIQDFKSVIVFRDPREVAKHYSKTSKNPIVVFRALETWKKYNKRILEKLKDKTIKEYILLDFGKLMESDYEILRLQEFIGSELIDNRKKRLYKNRKASPFIIFASKITGASKLYKKLLILREVQINS